MGSSEQKQAAFIRELFAAWDNHRTQILHMNFMWLHDVADSKLKEFETYYGFSSKEFIEFSLTEFSVDDKTLQDGRLEPEKISNLIIADPAAVHNKTKGIRTLWVSDLIFK